MVDRDTPQHRPVDPDKQVLNDLYQDAMGMGPSPERYAALGTVWEMAGELAVQEAVRDQVARDIARGQELARSRAKTPEVLEGPTYEIAKGSIGWITETPKVDVVRKVTPEGHAFWLGSITELSGRTKVDTSFMPEARIPEVEEIITGHITDKLDSSDHRVRALRPLRKDDDTKKHTSLIPYSNDGIVIDGYKNGDIRALVLEDPKGMVEGAEPVFLIGSICRHDEDKSKIYQL